MKILLENYNNLLSKVQEIIKKTQENIIQNANHEKVVMSWQLGKIIDEHLLKDNRAEYGAKLFKQLEADILIDKRVLYQMRSFYKSYPSLPEAEKKLSWSHYKNLSSVKNEEKRKYLEELTINNNLGAVRLQREITKLNSRKKPLKEKSLKKKSTKLSVQRGLLFTYKIALEIPKQVRDYGGLVQDGGSLVRDYGSLVQDDGSLVQDDRGLVRDYGGLVRDDGGLVQDDGVLALSNLRHPEAPHRHPELVSGSRPKTFVDCGFNIFTEIKTSLKTDGEIVESVKKGTAFSLKKSVATPQQLHIYKAFLEKVVDGDTLRVTLDLGFKIRHKEILRLAKINAPEITTAEGKRSAEALQEILKDVEFLILKTKKTDIYGRYVADVFFAEGVRGSNRKANPQKVADEGVYLNQLLLDKGLAEVY